MGTAVNKYEIINVRAIYLKVIGIFWEPSNTVSVSDTTLIELCAQIIVIILPNNLKLLSSLRHNA